jgi:hypothetical protein
MFIGVFIFGLVAVLCVVAGVVAIRRRHEYGNRDGGDDFDFDAYEGFDK